MRLVPITLDEAKSFVREHHRHNKPPVGWKFGVGVEECGQLVGVAVVGRPSSRVLQANEPRAAEVTRVCTLGNRNANSMLYGAIARAAAALGYERLYTYTLQSESGASLRACGWEVDAHLKARSGWDAPSRRRDEREWPNEPKIRWRKAL